MFQYKGRVSEEILAKKLDFILSYTEEATGDKKYLGAIIPENNVGGAFINECKKYPWFQYMMKERKVDSVSQENIVQKYGFRTTSQSKDLIIREYRIALQRKEIGVTPELYDEICTYQYDKNNSANAMMGYHDDLLMADMIAHNSVLHEPFTAKYHTKPRDEEDMSIVERHLMRLRRGDYEDDIGE